MINVHSIVFEDQITLWWQEQQIAKTAFQYRCYLDGTCHGETGKTHYTFDLLSADKAYNVRIERIEKGALVGDYECIIRTGKAKSRIDVTKAPYNAVSDGKTLNTEALQKALDDCTEKACVYFPKGRYLTGALNVHSDTEIYLEEGAVLQGTQSEKDYLPKIWSRFEGQEQECYRSLINIGTLDHAAGYTTRNVYLRGKGRIYGGGKALAVAMQDAERERLKDYLQANAEYVATCETKDTIPGRVRGRLINMSNCENVVLNGLTLGYGPAWNIHFVYSKNVTTYGCKIVSNKEYDGQGNLLRDSVWNGDGWNPDSSEDCAIFDCDFRTGDDCVAIKSGKNPEGNVVNRPTRNVYVFDCRVKDGHSISIGSEMSGGVENVYVWDCDLSKAYFGIQVKSTKKRGGYVKNLSVRDTVSGVIYVRSATYNDDGDGAPTPPILSDYRFENVKVLGAKTVSGEMVYVHLSGFNEEYPVRGVTLKNVSIAAPESEAIQTEYVEDLVLEDVSFEE